MQTLSFLASGAGLLLALRAVLAGWPSWAPLVALAVSGMTHVVHVTADARRAHGPHE
jgi:hypothetical protein